MKAGDALGPYEIKEPLGAGGMGEVYRAHDPRLERDVAIKVLPAELAADAGRFERFQREAKAVAALSHPNIVTVYSVEEHDGTHFLTMEMVPGHTLDRLIPAGGMPAAALLELAVPLADAVAAAHERGIVHRDLKPANIIVGTGNRVKVLDFGLAKLSASRHDLDASSLPTEAWATQEGLVVGTVPYMSPEQVEGRPLDHRTDVFSLGVILYEMATGRRPFTGGSSPALMASILKDIPTPAIERNPELPRHLSRVIGRCLQKDVTERYQTALDVRNELRLLRREIGAPDATGTPPGPLPVSTTPMTSAASHSSTPSLVSASSLQVAVTPFVARGDDADVAAFAEGVSETLLAGLARFSYMNVVSAEASPALRNRPLDADAVAEQLGARYVLEGSVRRAGRTTRVSARLIDAATGAHVWAENYDRELGAGDVFALQDDIAARICSTTCDLAGVLPRVIGELLKARPPETLTPYEAVLRKFNYYHDLSAGEHAEVRANLERAVQKDPRSANAWAALSLMVCEEHKHGFNVRPDPLQRALDAARRATTIDPAAHLGQHALAQAHFFRKEFEPFRVAADRAIALNPWDAVTVAFMGILMAYSGDWDHGVQLARDAARLNPHHPGWFSFAEVWWHYRRQEWQEALAVAQHINMPTYFYTPVVLAFCYARLGRRDEARRALDEALAMVPDLADIAEAELSKWLPPDVVEMSVEGLRMAGLGE